MIVIRGIKGEAFARQIEKGIIGCRDILSALFSPPKTGYAFSDFYEKNLVTALMQVIGKTVEDFYSPEVLFSLLADFFVPYIYISYFHIINPNSINWLNTSFDDSDDTFFIALNIEIDRVTQTAFGNEIIGSSIKYIDSIKKEEQDGYNSFTSAVLNSIISKAKYETAIAEASRIYNTLIFPLLLREVDSKFTEFENEFRVIAYDCPSFNNGVISQVNREIVINGNSGATYKGIIIPGYDYPLNNTNRMVCNPTKTLREILLNEDGKITLNSFFKQVNIRSIASSYRFIGNKKDCEKYIMGIDSSSLNNNMVENTVINHYTEKDFEDCRFYPSKHRINY